MIKIIKRRHEGEYTNTYFIMWQNQKGCFRLFINIFSYQINYNYGINIKGLGDIRVRKILKD